MINKVKVTLEKDLRKKLGIRRFPIMKGDVVKIIKGSRRGEGGKVAGVDHKHSLIILDGINIAKADGKEKSFPIQPEKIEITKLDLTMDERTARIKELAAMKNVVVNDDLLEQYSTKEEPEPEQLTEAEEASENASAEEIGENSEESATQDDGEDDRGDVDDKDEEVEENEEENSEEMDNND
jgi:large subunit ribosomal protein L24